jgi:DUF2946 family protein
VTRSPWFRAGLFLLVVSALLVSGAGHVVLHGDDGHGHDHGDVLESMHDAHCVACNLQLADWNPVLVVRAAPLLATPMAKLGSEAPHTASTRGRAAPRAPPVRA